MAPGQGRGRHDFTRVALAIGQPLSAPGWDQPTGSAARSHKGFQGQPFADDDALNTRREYSLLDPSSRITTGEQRLDQALGAADVARRLGCCKDGRGELKAHAWFERTSSSADLTNTWDDIVSGRVGRMLDRISHRLRRPPASKRSSSAPSTRSRCQVMVEIDVKDQALFADFDRARRKTWRLESIR